METQPNQKTIGIRPLSPTDRLGSDPTYLNPNDTVLGGTCRVKVLKVNGIETFKVEQTQKLEDSLSLQVFDQGIEKPMRLNLTNQRIAKNQFGIKTFEDLVNKILVLKTIQQQRNKQYNQWLLVGVESPQKPAGVK